MKYITIAENAKKAYKTGIQYILNNTIPSIWCENGKGWQEIWKTAPYAGLYASCMGIELISKYSTPEIEDLKINVYSNITCAMNPEQEVKDEREKEMREKNLNITLKAVRYLAATNYMDNQHINHHVVKHCLQQVENAIRPDGSFLPAIGSLDESILTTYEVLLLLKNYWINKKEFLNSILRFFENLLNDNITIYSQNDIKDNLLIALNIIFHFNDFYSAETIDKAKNLFFLFQNSWGNETKIENRFHVPNCNYIQDIYSISKPILILDTMLEMVRKKIVSFQFLNKYLPFIEQLIERVINMGYYSTTQKDISFGINYRALILLWKIYTVINCDLQIKESSYMIVNPNLFHEQEFTLKDDLVVVLMPFKPRWSNAVFQAFKEAVESKGLSVWRSDIEHKDDQIIQTIWSKINQAKFIIADCTGKNPNVFYELGISHTIGKSVFLCSQRNNDYPFDISGIRHFNYEAHDFPSLKANIIKFIEEKFSI